MSQFPLCGGKERIWKETFFLFGSISLLIVFTEEAWEPAGKRANTKKRYFYYYSFQLQRPSGSATEAGNLNSIGGKMVEFKINIFFKKERKRREKLCACAPLFVLLSRCERTERDNSAFILYASSWAVVSSQVVAAMRNTSGKWTSWEREIWKFSFSPFFSLSLCESISQIGFGWKTGFPPPGKRVNRHGPCAIVFIIIFFFFSHLVDL